MSDGESRRSFLARLGRGTVGVVVTGASSGVGAVASGEIMKRMGEQLALPDDSVIHAKAVAAVEEAAKSKSLLPKEIIELYLQSVKSQSAEAEHERNTIMQQRDAAITKAEIYGGGIGGALGASLGSDFWRSTAKQEENKNPPNVSRS